MNSSTFAIGIALLAGSMPVLAADTLWTEAYVGSTSSRRLNAVHFPSRDTGYAAGNGIIVKTVNGGRSWVNVTGSLALDFELTELHFPTPNVGYAAGMVSGTSQGRLIKTTNGGATWTRLLPDELFVAQALRFTSRDTGFLGFSGRVLGTRDGGATWTSHSIGTTRAIRSFDFPNPNVGYAAGFDGSGDPGVFKTTNGGHLWTALSAPGTGQFLQGISCPTPSVCYAATEQGAILKTTNGLSFSAVYTPSSNQPLNAIQCPTTDVCYAVGKDNRILSTVNGGSSWSPMYARTKGTRDWASLFVFEPGKGYLSGGNAVLSMGIAVGAPSGLAYSPDSGMLPIGAPMPIRIPFFSGGAQRFTVTPALPQGIVLDTVMGIISGTPLSASPMATYSVIAWGPGGSDTATVKLGVNYVPVFSYARPDTLYHLNIPLRPDTPKVAGPVSSFTVAPPLPAGLTLNATTGVLQGTPTAASPATNHVVTARNSYDSSSVTLRIQVAGVPAPTALSYAPPAKFNVFVTIAPVAPVASGLHLRYSVAPALPEGLLLDSLTGTISGQPLVVAAPAEYVVTAANAGGQVKDTLTLQVVKPAWVQVGPTFVDLTFSYTRVCFPAPGHGYVFRSGYLSAYLKTTDGGASWTHGLSDGRYSITSCVFKNTTTGYVAGGSGLGASPWITKTTNGGATWEAVPGTFNWANGPLSALAFPDDITGYALNNDGWLRKSANSGATWDTIASNVPERVLVFPTVSTGFAAGRQGRLTRTTNGGTTWQALATGTSANLNALTFADRAVGYLVGDSGVVRKTADSGATWTALNPGVRANLNAVAFLSADRGYIVGDSGVLLRTVNGGASWTRENTGGRKTALYGIAMVSAMEGYVTGASDVVLKYDGTGDTLVVVDTLPVDTVPVDTIPPDTVSTRLASLAAASGVSVRDGALHYVLAAPGPVHARLLDLNGRELWSLRLPAQAAGAHVAALPTLGPGVHLLHFRAAGRSTLLKIRPR